MRAERLHGYDPYDALCAPMFRLPVLRSNRFVRFGAQQVVKRLPVNVRPIMRIPKGLNPVSAALYLQGLAHRAQADGEIASRHVEAERCVSLLATLASDGWSGACWGYPFDWEGRYASIPAGTPTIVATGMVANALAVAGSVFELSDADELVRSSADFVLNDLTCTDGPEGSLCWSYSPLDRTVVLNATLKGARLLSQAHAAGLDAAVLEPARRSARFVVLHQSGTGAWPYAIGDSRSWSDNFHTGYILECLSAYRRATGDASVSEALDRGWRHYRRSFFTSDMTPKYFDDRVLPTDATACAQAIITLCAFGDVAAARASAARAVAILSRPDGSFCYQRRRRVTVKVPYLRWSTAWMYCALARLAAAMSADRDRVPSRALIGRAA